MLIKEEVTELGIKTKIKSNRIHYLVYDGHSIYPESVEFIATFYGSPVIKGLRFDQWISSMLNNKIVVPADSIPNETVDAELKKIAPLEEPYLIVQDRHIQYLTVTLFNIITKLVEDNTTLISLKWNK